MRKIIRTIALMLCLIVAPCSFLLVGCGNKEDASSNSSNNVNETFTLTISYDYDKTIFSNVKESITVKKGEWVTDLPTVVDAYADDFLGWFIVGTEKQIDNYDVIGGNATLEARFKDVGTSPVKDGTYYVLSGENSELMSASLVFDGSKVTMAMAVDPGIIYVKENEDKSTGTYEQSEENVEIDFGSAGIVNLIHGVGNSLTLDADSVTTVFKLMAEDELISAEKSLLRESFGYTQGNDYAYKIIPLEEIDANGIQKVKIERYNLWATNPPTKDETFATVEGRCAVSGYGIELEFDENHSWFGTYSFQKITTGENAGKTEVKLTFTYDCNYIPGINVNSMNRVFTYYI